MVLARCNQSNFHLRKRGLLRQRHHCASQSGNGRTSAMGHCSCNGWMRGSGSFHAAGLLLVLSTAISHDLMKKIINPDISDQQEIRYARIASFGALAVAAYFGINPPSSFVAKTVAFAFGLAASSFFPTLIMGIFSKKINKEGAIAGMICGIGFTMSYIIYFQFLTDSKNYWFGISPEGIGFVGMFINFIIAFVVSSQTSSPIRSSGHDRKHTYSQRCRKSHRTLILHVMRAQPS